MARATAIKVFHGDELKDTIVFEREIIKIGRLASAHLRLEDKKVSRIHAVIEVHEDVSIIDMGSAEGTRVNGEKISRHTLRHGDDVQLGDSRLLIVLDEAEIAALQGDGEVSGGHVAAAAGFEAPVLTDPGIASGEIGALTDLVPEDDPAAGLAGGVVDGPTFESGDDYSVANAPAPTAAAAPAPAAPMPTPQVIPPGPMMMAAPLPPIPEDPITATNRHVEVALRWGGTVVEVVRIREQTKFSIGVTDSDDMFVPVDEFGGGQSFPLLSQSNGNWDLHFTPQMSGNVHRNGQDMPLKQAGQGTLHLEDGMMVEIALGYLTIEVKTASKSKVVPVIPFLDTFFLNSTLVTLFTFASVMSVLLLLPTGLDDGEDDLLSNINQFQTVILKPPPKDNDFLKKLAKSKKAKAASGDKGKAGKKKAKKTDGRMASKSKEKKPTDEQVVAQKLDALFGTDGNSGVASLFGAASGGELEAALGGISGSRVADSYGAGGLGTRGGGPGGGGVGVGTLGIGAVGTLGRGTGQGGYGAGVGGLGGKTDRKIGISQGTPMIMGSLDKEIIRRVVREHMSQIRYCYERELVKNPGLSGKITMKWIINGSGRVTTSTVADTSMKSKPVESCIARKIRGWRFPKPKGGGIVIVNYPFVFKKSG